MPSRGFAVTVNLVKGRTRPTANHAGADSQDYQTTGMLKRVGLPAPRKPLSESKVNSGLRQS